MLRTALWVLRQRRYAALAAGMVVVALICVAAGTWQISRFEQSVRDNDALTANAHAAPVPLSTTLVPLSGAGPAPGRDAIRYRTVTATGTYIGGPAQFLRNQTLNGVNGYDVLSPLRTSGGFVLVVRGFVAADDRGAPPTGVPAPPAGVVRVTGRLQTPSSNDDRAGQLGDGQLESVNPVEQAGRLGAPVYDAYLSLVGGQPGTAGVTVLPDPDLSNPAGGAYEAQHFAYIIQWYLFALLALAAPFAIGRSELREARRRFLGIDPGEEELGVKPVRAQDGRRQLTSTTATDGAVAVRGGTVVHAGQPTPEEWKRAARLADRYGRSLGIGDLPADDVADSDEPLPPRRPATGSGVGLEPKVANSADHPHRSHDSYQGSYNDYLWELALADGDAPEVNPTLDEPSPDDRRR